MFQDELLKNILLGNPKMKITLICSLNSTKFKYRLTAVKIMKLTLMFYHHYSAFIL